MTRDPIVIAGLLFIAFMLLVAFPAGARLAVGLSDYYELELPAAP